MNLSPLLPLPQDWEPTRATLHTYAKAVSVIARAHAVPDPRWWHVSLTVEPIGLTSDSMSLPDDGTFSLRMDLRDAAAIWETSGGEVRVVPLNAGLTGSQFGERLIEIAAEFGLEADYDRERFANDEERGYESEHAVAFFDALLNVATDLSVHRSTLNGDVGPLQLWPHGFDLAFEVFGTKMIEHTEGGVATASPSQLNLGFYPAGRAYFYSNPWPFVGDELLGVALPEPASWNTGDWEGSILYYDELLSLDDSETTLLEYARTVYDAAWPTLAE